MAKIKQLESHICFGGAITTYSHFSKSCQTDMNFSLFVPGSAGTTTFPLILVLSGLTCTNETFAQKSTALKYASTNKIALLFADTSPRGVYEDLEENNESFFGSSASFYINAIQKPWNKHYKMYDYCASEALCVACMVEPKLDGSRVSIMGHSMGGHGALLIGLKNQDKFKSISAFAPIANAMNTKWGDRAFKGYFGNNKELHIQNDATEIIKSGIIKEIKIPIKIDQGTKDHFYLEGELLPENFVEAAKSISKDKTILEFSLREGYDHSYWFVQSFVEDHINFHLRQLNSD